MQDLRLLSLRQRGVRATSTAAASNTCRSRSSLPLGHYFAVHMRQQAIAIVKMCEAKKEVPECRGKERV